jgi:hypothetical protein
VGTPVSFTNKANHQDITEILLKVALNTVKQTLNACNSSKFMFTARDVVNNLKENEINSSQDFSWISQLSVCFTVFNATFNNISVISWWLALLVKETRVPTENHRPVASH